MGKKKICLKEINLKNYNITGFYYSEEKYNFRKYLNIKSRKYSCSEPDLMVIMMNPGSSSPLDKDDNGRHETEAKPDVTQKQIIRVMELGNYKYVKVLNLSDLREPKSSCFYKEIASMESKGIEHSIFKEMRLGEFNEYYKKRYPCYLCLGSQL